VLPGRRYTPEDILRVAWRRKWLILGPLVTVSIATALVAWQLPNRYRSSTTIVVVPQRVPDAYVRSTVSTPNEREVSFRDRIETLKGPILSRTRLERLILDLNLYPNERQTWLMEDVVQKMRGDISVLTMLRGDSFEVSFTYEDPRLTLDVVNKLAAAFVDESNQDRSLFAESTTTFLESQLDEARRNLELIENKVADYRRRHSGELPTEREANLQVLSSTQLQVQSTTESINRDRDRRFLLERTLAELSVEGALTAPVALAPTSPTGASGVTGQTAAEQLQAARGQLREFGLRFTQDHPDVKRMVRMIADLELKAEQEAKQKPRSPDAEPARPASLQEQQRQTRMRDLRLEIEGLDRVIATKLQEEKDLRAKIAEYQRRVEATPARETELTSLLRDYSTVQLHYGSLLGKQGDSKIAAALERRQIGEQFRPIDQALLPDRPASPNRPLIDLAGAIAGLAIGLGMVAFLDYRDNSFRTDEEVVRVLALPVVAMIPVMLSRSERRVQRRRMVLVAAAMMLVFLAAASGALWWFRWRHL
jgi:polysaccharide chain length determinant protein (PEP-CTERM system associated)